MKISFRKCFSDRFVLFVLQGEELSRILLRKQATIGPYRRLSVSTDLSGRSNTHKKEVNNRSLNTQVGLTKAACLHIAL